MKEGDKILCKNDYTFIDSKFKTGEWYEIHQMNYSKLIGGYVITFESKGESKCEYVSFIKGKKILKSWKYFEDYFYTEQELRELKLNRINERRG